MRHCSLIPVRGHILVLCILVWPALIHAQIPCLSGIVRDALGNPVADVDLDFIDPVSGVKLVTPGDNTDATGFYSVCVLPGTYHVTFAPAPGSHLLGRMFLNVDLSTGRVLDLTLDFGAAVFGTVTDTAGQPVGEVDLDVDALSGGRLFTPGDNTDPATGSYWIVVPQGSYRVRFDPPPGSRLRGLQLDTVLVTGDQRVDAVLSPGLMLTGHVRDVSGLGLSDVDVELRDINSGNKVFLSNNTTDLSGLYSVAVPMGTFDFRFVPPRASHLLGVLIDSFVIAGDQIFDQTMERGVLLTSFVHDLAGDPIANADIDIKQESNGLKLFTPNDKSDSLGVVQVAIPPGLYTVQVDPPVGSIFDQAVIDSVMVSGDTTIDIQLVEVARILFSGRVVDESGAGVAGAHIGLLVESTGKSVFVRDDLTDSSGFFNAAVPTGVFKVLIAPPETSRLVGERRDNVTFANDTTWGPIVLKDGALVNVHVFDEQGQAAAGADLDFITEPGALEVYTPYDNVDLLGEARVALTPGVYTLRVQPPAGSGFVGAELQGLELRNDTTLTVILSRVGGALPELPFILRQNFPNPFNGETRIRFIMLQQSSVSIQVYNILGQHVKSICEGARTVGLHEISWNGTDESGQDAASGMYFYRLEVPGASQTRRLVLLR